MEQHTYEALRKEARTALDAGRLGDALHALEGLTGAGGQWDNISALGEIKEAYGMMLDYMERGSADPGREAMYTDFVRRAGELLDRVERDRELHEARSRYATVRVTLDRLGQADWTVAARRLVENAEALAAFRHARPADEGSNRVRSLREEHVRLYRTLFEALATGAPWTPAEAEAAAAFLSEAAPAVADKGLDPNMDSWPLDATAIVNILNTGDLDQLIWGGDYDENSSSIADAQNVRGFHTLEFLLFKDGQARTVPAE